MIFGIIDGIRPDPVNPGWALMTASEMVMPIREDELDQLHAGTTSIIDRMVSEVFAAAIEAMQQYEGRLATNARHPIVHALARPARVDLPRKAVDADYARLSSVRDEARNRARMQLFVAALDRLQTLTEGVERFGERIEGWENSLIGGARIWAIGLTILKDLLIAAASGGVSTMLKGASFLGAVGTFAGAAVVGGGAAAGASAIDQKWSGEGVSFGRTAKAFGVGAGEAMGVFAPATGNKLKEELGVAKAATDLGKYGGGAAVDFTVAATLGGAASAAKGDTWTDYGVGVIGSTVGGVGSQLTKDLAGERNAAARVVGGAMGSATATGQAALAGKSRDEVIAAGISAGVTGSTGADIEQKVADRAKK
jgi:hypothetical protein